MLKLEVIRRAVMILKNEKELCLSHRVHDALKDAKASNISFILQNLIDQGELITLRQLVYYMNELGLRLDLTANSAELIPIPYLDHYFDTNTKELAMSYDYDLNKNIASYTPYLVGQVVRWHDAFTLCVHVIPLRDRLRKIQDYYNEDTIIEDDYEEE